MPTPYDLTFFKIAIHNAVTDQATATRCLQYIDTQAQSGQTVRAPDLLLKTGVDKAVVERLTSMTQSVMKQQQSTGEESLVSTQRSSAGGLQNASQRIPTQPPADRSSRRLMRTEASASVRLEELKLGEKVGAGPSGQLVRATTPDGRTVALKALTRKFQKNPAVQQAITAQLQRAFSAGLRHENLTTILALGTLEERDALAMEWVEAPSLEATLKAKGRLSPKEAAETALALARGLEHAHARKVYHGDLRPAKVLGLGREAKLTDFGLATASALIQGFGRDGLSFGHPCYLAPEVIQQGQREPTEAADLYALGVTLFELLSGRKPFAGQETSAVLEQALRQPLPKPPSDTPKALAELLLQLTAKDPNRRLSSAARAASALEASLQSLGGAMGDAEWGNASEEAAAGQKEWSEEKVRKAKDPKNFDPDSVDLNSLGIDDPLTSRRSSAPPRSGGAEADALANLAAALVAGGVGGDSAGAPTAEKKGKASTPAPAATTSPAASPGKKEKKKKKKGSAEAGQRFELQSEHIYEEQARTRRKLGLVVTGLLFFGVVGAFVIGLSGVKKPPAVTGREDPKATPYTAPETSATPDPKVKAQSDKIRNDARQEALAPLRQEIQALLAKQAFNDAIRKIDEFPGDLRADPKTREELAELRRSVDSTAASSFALVASSVEQALKAPSKASLDGATKLLDASEPGLAPNTLDLFRSLRSRVEAAVGVLANAPPPMVEQDDESLKPYQRDLKKILAGRCNFSGETLTIVYDFSEKRQLDDFDLPKDRAAVDTASASLLLRATADGLHILFPIPPKLLKRVECRFDLGNVKLNKESLFGLEIGVDPVGRTSGLRLTNDSRILRFDPNGESIVTRGNPAKDSWRAGLRLIGAQSFGRRVRGALEGQQALELPPATSGLCGVYLRDLSLKIDSLTFELELDEMEVKTYLRRRVKKR